MEKWILGSHRNHHEPTAFEKPRSDFPYSLNMWRKLSVFTAHHYDSHLFSFHKGAHILAGYWDKISQLFTRISKKSFFSFFCNEKTTAIFYQESQLVISKILSFDNKHSKTLLSIWDKMFSRSNKFKMDLRKIQLLVMSKLVRLEWYL